jgi:hypothetical protein
MQTSSPKILNDFQLVIDKLKQFGESTKIWQMIPNTNNTIIIADDLSVKDTIEILHDNMFKRCLLINPNNESELTLFMLVDFINLILSFQTKNRELLSSPDRIQRFLEDLTMKSLVTEYKKYMSFQETEVIAAKVI